MNTAGQENEQDTTLDDANIDSGQEGGDSKKEIMLSPLSTLESSFEALNIKKFNGDHDDEGRTSVVDESPIGAGATYPSYHEENESDFEDSEDELCSVKALHEEDMSDIFAPPKDPKSLLLPEKRAPCNNRLPDDSCINQRALSSYFFCHT